MGPHIRLDFKPYRLSHHICNHHYERSKTGLSYPPADRGPETISPLTCTVRSSLPIVHGALRDWAPFAAGCEAEGGKKTNALQHLAAHGPYKLWSRGRHDDGMDGRESC